MKPFLPKRYEAVIFGLLLSGLMSCIVSGLSTAISLGLNPEFPIHWLRAWIASWCVAFPAVLVVAPMVRRILNLIIIRDQN